ncbi:Uncharacterised protein g8500 [Pycnogonum litorale]
MILFNLLSIFYGVKTDNSRRFCDRKDTRKCVKTVEHLLRYEAVRFVNSRMELFKICQRYIKSLTCMDRYSNECLTQEKRAVIQHFMSGPRKFILNVCNPGEYQRRFLTLAPCFNARNTTYGAVKCTEILARRQKRIKKVVDFKRKRKEDKTKVKDGISGGICRALHEFRNCSRAIVMEHCGRENADFYDTVLVDITAPLVVSSCRTLTNQSTKLDVVLLPFVAFTSVFFCIITVSSNLLE